MKNVTLEKVYLFIEVLILLIAGSFWRDVLKGTRKYIVASKNRNNCHSVWNTAIGKRSFGWNLEFGLIQMFLEIFYTCCSFFYFPFLISHINFSFLNKRFLDAIFRNQWLFLIWNDEVKLDVSRCQMIVEDPTRPAVQETVTALIRFAFWFDDLHFSVSKDIKLIKVNEISF